MSRLFLFTCSLLCLTASACNKAIQTLPPAEVSSYFPPVGSLQWQSTSPAELGWNQNELNALYAYLESVNTKAFMIIKNGKIVTERYYGNFTADSNWYWASAGKTMTALLVGIAQQEGLLNINDRTSKFLGQGWTTAPLQKENMITVRHQLTMTSGLDDGVIESDCTTPACLRYKADAGTRWAYHNAPYTVLDKVVESATRLGYNAYFQQKIRDKIGMNGVWIKTGGYNNVYYSTPRSMARFGLLLLNKGVWNGTPIFNDSAYFNQQVNTSQPLNQSYGYLTWLNGKSSFMVPTVQAVFPGSLVKDAPGDMYAALGKNDQKLYVVPSQQLVVVRMGNAADASLFGPTGFDNELWTKLKRIIGY